MKTFKASLIQQAKAETPNIDYNALQLQIQTQLAIYSEWGFKKFTLKNVKRVLVSTNVHLYKRAMEARSDLPGDVMTQELQVFVSPIKSMHWLKTVLFKGNLKFGVF